MKKSILKYFKAFTLVGIMASVVVLSSCGEDDGGDPPVVATENILELIQSTDGLDSLYKYLSRYPSLTGALSANAEYTFFAPNNDAFIGLLETPGFPSSIELINPAIIEGVMAYHVVSGSPVLQAEFTTETELTTLYTDAATQTAQTIKFNADGTLLTGSSNKAIEVVTGDIAATNGVMHVTGSVLIPPSVEATLTPILGTLAGSVLLGKDFSILADGIRKADFGKPLAETISAALATGKDLTIFAPTNATFEAAQITAASLEPAQWDAIIRNHVVVGQGGATDDGINTLGLGDLTTGSSYETLLGQVNGGTLRVYFNTEVVAAQAGTVGIFLDANSDYDFDNPSGLTSFGGQAEAEVVLPDAVNISQGRIHVIAGILNPTPPTD